MFDLLHGLAQQCLCAPTRGFRAIGTLVACGRRAWQLRGCHQCTEHARAIRVIDVHLWPLLQLLHAQFNVVDELGEIGEGLRRLDAFSLQLAYEHDGVQICTALRVQLQDLATQIPSDGNARIHE